MLLYFIRHGDPIYSPDSLTEKGKKQAEALSLRLSRFGFDEIYSSDSHRAVMTAAPTAELLKKDINLLPWCNEGLAWEQLSLPDGNGGVTWCFQIDRFKKLFVSDEISKLGEQWYTHKSLSGCKLGQGIERIRKQTDGFLKSLGYEHDRENKCYKSAFYNEKRIALFAHQGFGLAFLSCLLDIPYPQFCTHFDMGHTGVTVIYFEPQGDTIPKVLQLSNDSHLYKENLTTDYQNGINI